MSESAGPDLTLFEGTAWYYARYRPAYPRWLFDLIVERFEQDLRLQYILAPRG